MPRKAIELPDHLAYLSILDEYGRVDTQLMPDLAEDQLLHFHCIMLLSRRFDERLLSLQRQGRIGTFAPIKGQEEAQIGVVAPLQSADWVVPAFRETAAAIYRGTPLAGLFIFQAGYNEGGHPRCHWWDDLYADHQLSRSSHPGAGSHPAGARGAGRPRQLYHGAQTVSAFAPGL